MMKDQLSAEEIEILNEIENGDFKSVIDLENMKTKYMAYANNTLKKDKRINIRISERDLLSIQRKAVQEGLPYQTLISSLLHKYISGRLVEA